MYCLTHSQQPVPCQSTKPEPLPCILWGASRWSGAHVKKQTFFDIAGLVKSPARNPILPSKPRLVSCPNARPLKRKDELLLDLLPPPIEKTAVKREDTCLKSKWQTLVKCAKVSLASPTATVKLENQGQRQSCVAVWSHGNKNFQSSKNWIPELGIQRRLLSIFAFLRKQRHRDSWRSASLRAPEASSPADGVSPP